MMSVKLRVDCLYTKLRILSFLIVAALSFWVVPVPRGDIDASLLEFAKPV